MNKIPLFKVRMEHDDAHTVMQTLYSGYLGEGPRVKDFERNLREVLNLPRQPVAVSSGTAALDLAYELIGIGKDDQVLITPMTCFATVAPLLHRGARILWCDIDANGNFSWKQAWKDYTAFTKAIVCVDWAGRPANHEKWRTEIPVVQDAAHSIGSVVYGDHVCYSFQAIKHLTTGDGGALLCPEPEEERARRLRWFGLDRTKGESFRCAQDIKEPGFKYAMNDVAASIGLANLQGLNVCLGRHREVARKLWEGLSRKHLVVPPFDPVSSYWTFTVLAEDKAVRDSLEAHLKAAGIDCGRVHRPCDEHPCVAEFKRELPGVRLFDATHLEIPCGWWVDDEDVLRICEEVERWTKF